MNTGIWDRVTAPMLVLSPYVLRISRWQWFGDDALATDTPLSIIADEPAHPLFEGIPLDGGASGPWHEFIDRGTNFPNSEVINGGTLLASTDTLAVVAAEWPAGTVAAGPRMFLALGSQEASGTSVAEAGKWESVTELGQRALLNAVAYFTPPLEGGGGSGADPAFRITAAVFDIEFSSEVVTVTFTSEPGKTYRLRRSIDGMVTWTDVPGATVTATGVSTSATDAEAPAAPAYYQVLREG
jgi:hypothetical protein